MKWIWWKHLGKYRKKNADKEECEDGQGEGSERIALQSAGFDDRPFSV
jgi:hypothetical protein